MAPPHSLLVAPLGPVPAIGPGDDLTQIVLDACIASAITLRDGDAIVLAQKIVSKAEGRMVHLGSVTPSEKACRLAAETGKDPRLVELILSEAQAVVRARPGHLIVRHRNGVVLANAGIDRSNVDADEECVLLLPVDADRSAAAIRDAILARTGRIVAVLVIDSVGRAWRNGTIGTAIGVSGMAGLLDLRGAPDRHGRPLQSSELGFADEVAAAASLVMGQADEGRPIALVRGLAPTRTDGSAAELLRAPALDLFG